MVENLRLHDVDACVGQVAEDSDRGWFFDEPDNSAVLCQGHDAAARGILYLVEHESHLPCPRAVPVHKRPHVQVGKYVAVQYYKRLGEEPAQLLARDDGS